MRATDGTRTVEVVAGDLLAADVDAIVNAANEHLEHGGGIAAIIAYAAGEDLERESREHPDVPTGDAAATTAGTLPQRAVIHAVGPVWRGGSSGEPGLLAGAHRAAVRVADEHGFESLALPAISCGDFGYPVPGAADVAVPAVREALEAAGGVTLARFCLVHDEHVAAFSGALERDAAAAGWTLLDP